MNMCESQALVSVSPFCWFMNWHSLSTYFASLHSAKDEKKGDNESIQYELHVINVSAVLFCLSMRVGEIFLLEIVRLGREERQINMFILRIDDDSADPSAK